MFGLIKSDLVQGALICHRSRTNRISRIVDFLMFKSTHIILISYSFGGYILSGRELRLRKTASSKLVVTFEISGKMVERNVINNLN